MIDLKTLTIKEARKKLGAKVAITGCNPLSTQDDIAAALAEEKDVQVWAYKGESKEDYYKYLTAVIETEPNFWKSIEDRSDAVKIKLDDSNKEAVVIDAMLSGGNVELREYDGYDKDTDYYLSKIETLNVSNVSVKAMILQRADEPKLDILIQDRSSNERFGSLLKELKL
jgi:S-adenosylhomocysteine hydrolase